jgi:hypothetical protein
MMKRRLLMISLIILVFTSCKKDNNSTTNPTPSLIGVWNVVAGATIDTKIEFTNGNAYTITEFYAQIERGTYAVSSNTVIFTPAQSSYCTLDKVTYTYTLSFTTLKLTKTNDNCTLRSSYINGWSFSRIL